jgi:hypothetical protein
MTLSPLSSPCSQSNEFKTIVFYGQHDIWHINTQHIRHYCDDHKFRLLTTECHGTYLNGQDGCLVNLVALVKWVCQNVGARLFQ